MDSRARVLLVAVCALALHTACVSDGSNVAELVIRGRVLTESGAPVANEQVNVLLPAEYGLGGLDGFDRAVKLPGDISHADTKLMATTDAEGVFELALGAQLYHVNVWLLPPLGALPTRPPAPFLLVQLARAADEYYAVQTSSGAFRVFGEDGQERPAEECALSRLEAWSEPEAAGSPAGTIAHVELIMLAAP